MPRLRVRKVLKKKGWSAYRLAKTMKIREQHVYRLLKEDADLRFSTLVRIAKALDCRVRDLIDE